MDKEMVKFFNAFRAKPDNKVCYECSAPNPTWASVPLGIILCMKECRVGAVVMFFLPLYYSDVTQRLYFILML
jgi:hypothetical protein